MFKAKNVATSREQSQNGVLQSGPIELAGAYILDQEIVLMTMPQGNYGFLGEVRIKGVDVDFIGTIAIGANVIESFFCPANGNDPIIFTVPVPHDPSTIGGEDVKLIVKSPVTLSRGYASARGWLL